ncbi:tetratricopeptide repeat protein [Kamptonema sp. UHCC 0994]|uniref:tetratricopeptide repeat protein n=1 Tax=Kamptonema sp. UHCC 0994 TaxID=3031329 RepID=UPI0023B96BF4|nr:tetratricopeptide repeat protein [Kamptonema sp. UHCC 0994]MDF0555613.1 tetratricopeptide repeat protein [Kamptonema sp. UHCC 0994]
MEKLVVLTFAEGDLDKAGFPVTLQMADEGKPPKSQETGSLPPNPEMVESYNSWKVSYYGFMGVKVRLEPPAGQATNFSIGNVKTNAENLRQKFNQWLKSQQFSPVREELLAYLTENDEVRLIIQTSNIVLRKLPWHLWDILERYSKVEIGVSTPKFKQVTSAKVANNQVNILAILGDNEGINVEEDRKILNSIPGAKIEFLVKPNQQALSDQFWEQSWDILFFAGHSRTDGETGIIYINRTESLTIPDLRYALKKAIGKGLQLAIFNSCDGLGLAQNLADLNLPQMIVMREPVPDKVAQEFLKYFLGSFSGGQSFYLAVKEAREKLQGWENLFPCATWLPVICQNQLEIPVNWKDLCSISNPNTDLSYFLTTPPDYPDFYGRQKELEEVEKIVNLSKNRVIAIVGEPLVGKTYFASQLAQRMSQQYKICWLSEQQFAEQENFTINDLLYLLNEFLKSYGELGFIQTYSQQKEEGIEVPISSKIARLVEVLKNGKKGKYAIFIDGKNRFSDLKYFVERFLSHGGESKLILIDNSQHISFPRAIEDKIFPCAVKGFSKEDAIDYLNQRCEGSGLECSLEDVTVIFDKTSGHPAAIDLIIANRLKGASLEQVLNELVKSEELRHKLLEDVSKTLNQKEEEAFRRLSVLRIPVSRLAWRYFDISEDIGNSLLERRLLSREGYDNFKIHPLYAEFWSKSQSKEEILLCHEKAANYYWEKGQQSLPEQLDRLAYLEAQYHFREATQDEKAAKVLNTLVGRIHQKERLPSERLPALKVWLLNLEDSIFADKPWLLLEKGRKLEKEGIFDKAKEIFLQAYEIFEHKQEQLGTSVALYFVGKMYALMEQYQLAINSLESVLNKAKSMDDKPMQIRTLGKMVSCYTDLREYEQAQSAAIDAYELSVDSGDKLGQALTLYRQGKILRHQGKFSEAETYFNDSAKAFQDLGDVYRESKSLARLGICQKLQGLYEEAKNNLKIAIDLKKSINDDHGRARDLDSLADIYTFLGEYDEAEECYKKSLKIKEGSDHIEPDLYGQIKTYNNLARLALSIGRFSEVEKLLQESEKRIDKQKQKHIGVNGARLTILVDLQFTEGEYLKALESCKEAANCFNPSNGNAPNSYARVLWSFGRIYLALCDFPQAKKYLEDSLSCFEKYEMDYHRVLAMTYISRVMVWDNPQESQIENQKAIDLAKTIKTPIALAACLETQGIIEEIKILSYLDLKKNGDQQQTVTSTTTTVLEYYDEALRQLNAQKVIWDVARLQVQKNLWVITVKHLLGQPILPDDAYGLLNSEPLIREVLNKYLINSKYLLTILNNLSHKLASNLATQALEVISPIALRFGLNTLRDEIEDLAFKFQNPREEYTRIEKELQTRFPNREEFIQKLKVDLEELLEVEEINAEVYPRAKRIYSIYRKIKARKVSLDRILDIVGIRIITNTEDECYKALDIVRDLGTTFAGEGILKESLRDYIKYPKKTTGYQSIHINILYGEPDPRIVEFQIRTYKMHLAAEIGIGFFGLDQATHRRYKDPSRYAHPSSRKNYELVGRKRLNLVIECTKNSVEKLHKIIQDKFDLLGVNVDALPEQNMIILEIEIASKKLKLSSYVEGELEKILEQTLEEIRKIEGIAKAEKKCSESLIKGLGLSIEEKALLIQKLVDEVNKDIYVLTPKKDVKKLRKGSTPIDFAYRIHEAVGHHCTSAIIDGHIVPLNTPLSNGNIVEIITQNNSHPTEDWLNIEGFVKTTKAKNKIRHWLKQKHREQYINRGQELIQDEINKNHIKFKIKSKSMQTVAERLNYQDVDDLLAAVGVGDLKVSRVINTIQKIENLQQPVVAETEELSFPMTSISPKTDTKDGDYKSAILGLEGILYRTARCCYPIPGDNIIGTISRKNQCISIHHSDCQNLNKIPNEQKISIQWDHTKNQNYHARIQIEVSDEAEVLSKILKIISNEEKINIYDHNHKRLNSNLALIYLTIPVKDVKQCQYLIGKIKKIPEVKDIQRINPTVK